MLKKEIRSNYRKKREGITAVEQQKWDDLLLIQFQSVELPFASYVLSFYPIEEYKEVNSFLLTDYLHFKNPNLQLCYPRTSTASNSMEAVICHADSIFETNAFHIPEPVDSDIAEPELLDIVIVPLLAFDLNGIRVGYGKGYYDRYLKQCRGNCLKIGVSYFEAIDSVEDADQFDVPLDLCITPQQTYVF
jgi:5-formyltetrahydrofolate cyclo-ligase